MTTGSTASPTRLPRHRSFVLFWCARTFTNGAFMMQGVAVGWQIYELTNDPLDLGLVGLVQFFPMIAMSVIAGQVLDLFDRRVIAAVCQVGKALAALLLAVGTAQGWLGREAMFAILFLSGTARAFEIPTMHSILPGIVPAIAAAARHRGLRHRPADRRHLRAVDRRLAVCARTGRWSMRPARSSSSWRAC